MNYYNEFDKDAATWLRALMDEGLIPKGEIDERSITEVEPGDLAGFRQCHFFAGIGGWPLALQLAGWPDDRPVWTGSCPCQPFSVAGKGLGEMDERHLWPVFRDLIEQCRPSTIFGEQVASKAGREWLAGVFADLEGVGYAVAGADLCAAGFGAPHIRQRLFWVANADGGECNGEPVRERGNVYREASGRVEGDGFTKCCGEDCGVGNADNSGSQGHHRDGDDGHQPGRIDEEQAGSAGAAGESGQWSESRLILCRDGKHRRIPTEPGLFPLADGLSYKLARRGSVRPALLKGAGNAIVPQVAAEFIGAFLES